MQTAMFKIWTQVAMFSSFNDNHYTISASLKEMHLFKFHILNMKNIWIFSLNTFWSNFIYEQSWTDGFK